MPTRMQDLTNTDLSALSASNNKNVMRYNASTGKFDVVEIDTTLGLASTPPQSFVGVVESKLDAGKLTFKRLDGGTF